MIWTRSTETNMNHLQHHRLENIIRDRITDTIPGVDRALAAGAAQAIGDALVADYKIEERERPAPQDPPPSVGSAIDLLANGLESVREGLCRFTGLTGEERP